MDKSEVKIIKEKILEQFDFLPRMINQYVMINYPSFNKDITSLLTLFRFETHERWENAEKQYNVKGLYDLPEEVFNKIEKQNQKAFIEVWNKVLKLIWKEIPDYRKRNKLFLMVRTHLIQDYGYFDSVDKNKLFRVKK